MCQPSSFSAQETQKAPQLEQSMLSSGHSSLHLLHFGVHSLVTIARRHGPHWVQKGWSSSSVLAQKHPDTPRPNGSIENDAFSSVDQRMAAIIRQPEAIRMNGSCASRLGSRASLQPSFSKTLTMCFHISCVVLAKCLRSTQRSRRISGRVCTGLCSRINSSHRTTSCCIRASSLTRWSHTVLARKWL